MYLRKVKKDGNKLKKHMILKLIKLNLKLLVLSEIDLHQLEMLMKCLKFSQYSMLFSQDQELEELSKNIKINYFSKSRKTLMSLSKN
jgi:hypothetical protein